ncbi:MAG: hypothetical protein IJU91_04200 [Selenomonadaceae bacterium]|nr:hypothetical protein [Selenomonadaceae bacterium]
MIYRKRFLRAVLIALTSALLLTGCGNDSSNTETPAEKSQAEKSQAEEPQVADPRSEIPKVDSKTSDLDEAKKVFMSYHKAITNQNYREAYELLSPEQKKFVGDYDSWILGFADTLTSEVSAMTLTSSEENAYTFDYTLTARDRHSVGNVKVQVFEGKVTMAKENGRWHIRSANSSQVDEKIVEELEKEQKAQLESEQKKREEKLANTSADKNLEQAAKLSAGMSTKEYLETIQPFVLADLIKKVSGIMGLLEDGSNERLEKYVMAMSLLAENERDRNTEISRDVAAYFEYDAQIAAAYVSMADKGLKEKAVIYAMIYKLGREQSKVEEKIQAVAKNCGADLNNFVETETIRRIINVVRNL